MLNPRNIKIQMARKGSIFSRPHLFTRSAFDKNLKARANSRKPKTTLTVLSHPPDFGKALSMVGKAAKKAKGNARARPKPRHTRGKLHGTSFRGKSSCQQ